MHDLVPRHPADRLAWGGVTAGGLVLTAALGLYWGANPGYADRLLILLAAGWAAATLAPWWKTLPVRPRPLAGLPLLAFAAPAVAAAVFLLPQIGPRALLLWWLALALAAAASGLALARVGVPRLRAALFPLLFPLFALPLPTRVLIPVQDRLQDVTTRLSFHALAALGQEVTRSEYVLALPGGKLGVEEACSGVRSLTTLTAIAGFVAFCRGFGPARGVLLVALSVPVVAAVNVLRVVLSGLIQEYIGPDYIKDYWHEALGFAMVFVGLGLILAMAGRLGRTPPADAELGPVADVPARGAALAAAVVAVGVGLAVVAGWEGRTSTGAAVVAAPLAELPTTLPGWVGADLKVPVEVTDLLAPDVAVYRRYANNVGQEAYVWAFYWRTGAAIKGYHHPDVCCGNKGFAATAKWVEAVPVAGGPAVGVTAREFRRGRDQQVVLYWTQEGRQVWTDADERAAAADMLSSSWTGHQWVGDLLGAGGRQAGPRLQVVVNVPAAGPAARKAAAQVAAQVAARLYEVCPWAKPE